MTTTIGSISPQKLRHVLRSRDFQSFAGEKVRPESMKKSGMWNEKIMCFGVFGQSVWPTIISMMAMPLTTSIHSILWCLAVCMVSLPPLTSVYPLHYSIAF